MTEMMFRFARAADAPLDRNDMKRRHRRAAGGRMRLRLAAVAAIGASFIAVLPTLSAFAQTPPASVGTIDITDPAAGINDPVADLAVLDRNCADGQLDVNVATHAELEQVLAIAPPTASRVVAARPFLRSLDLISVPGIGPAKEALLTSRACAEPVTLPPPSPLACEDGTTAVDLQSASAEEIAAKTHLGGPAASRLIAARPLPQDLQQITAPRVPGFSGPVAAKLVREGKVCVTPAPFTFAGKGWRWAYPAHGAVVSAPHSRSYQLFVPPGVVDSATGSWGTVLPLPERDSGRPRADLHIYGRWSGQVAVRLPEARLSANDAAMLTHEHADSPDTFTWGDATAVTDGTVTAATESLSDYESGSLPCLNESSTAILALFDCDDAPSDEPLASIGVRRVYSAQRIIEPKLTHGPCHDSGRVHSEGSLPLGLSCGHTGDGPPTVTWNLTNDTGEGEVLYGLFAATGAVYSVKPLSASGYSLTASSTANSFDKQFAEDLALELNLVLANTTVGITKAQGSGTSSFDVGGANAAAASAVWAVANAVSIISDAASFVPDAEVKLRGRQFVECVVNVLKSWSPEALAGCAEGPTGEGVLALLRRKHEQMDGRTTEAKRLKDSIERVGKLFKVVGSLTNAVASAITQTAVWIDGSGVVRFRYDLPPAPPRKRDGTILDDSSASGAVMVKLQSAPGQGWIVLKDYLAQEIRDVPSYTCFSHRYVLRDQLPFEKLLNYWHQESMDEAECDSAETTQYYMVGNETNYILRQYASGGGVAPAWFVDAESRLHPIPSGGVYRCLAQRYYVLDARSNEEMARFGPEETPALCP